MRYRPLIATTALLLASANLAVAQQESAVTSTSSSIDFGFRLSSTEGDKARYERYRDLRDGAFSKLSFGKDTDKYTLSAKVDNIGYDDQR